MSITSAPKATVSTSPLTYSDVVREVHTTEHAARELSYGERSSVIADLYAAVCAVSAATAKKAKAALSERHIAASKVDAKFAAAAADASSSVPFKTEHAPAVSAEELKTYRLELALGKPLAASALPHSGDKLSSSFFTGSWRKATLRWGPATLDGMNIVPNITVLWPKTPAQVAAHLASQQTFPPISSPVGMWLLRDTENGGHTSNRFYVVDGAYRAAYLADPNNKPRYAISWDIFVIENDPKFKFWVTQWNHKKSSVCAIDDSVDAPIEHKPTTEATKKIPAAPTTAAAAAVDANNKYNPMSGSSSGSECGNAVVREKGELAISTLV